MKNIPHKQRFILFNAWSGAIDRCHSADNAAFKDYGGRGIAVCDRWRSSFDAFVADMGVRPEGNSLDRIDVNQGYSPDNCRWADSYVQARNKRNTKLSLADITDIVAAAEQGHRPEAIAVFYGVTGSYIRRLTADRPAPLCKGMPGAKLTESQVVEMRARYADGESAFSLAFAYGVKVRNAFCIVKGQTWKHLN